MGSGQASNAGRRWDAMFLACKWQVDCADECDLGLVPLLPCLPGPSALHFPVLSHGAVFLWQGGSVGSWYGGMLLRVDWWNMAVNVAGWRQVRCSPAVADCVIGLSGAIA